MDRGPDYWRQKAAEYRASAQAAVDPDVRDAYLTLAENCDALAERQEQMNGHHEGKP
jgi:hypothetical protein